MDPVNIHAAKTNLSRLVEAAERGEEVVIARAGKPVVRMVRYADDPPKRRRLGILEGKVPPLPDDYDDPLPDDVLASFYGGELP
ncbi:MAG: type II toxin-antitoxin system prevent-host-death family antitoxin [Pseudomonadota bacterium]